MSRETPKKGERWRIFCAIELPQLINEQLMQHIAALRRAVPHAQASWARAASIHLTIKFLGEIRASLVERVTLAASKAVEQIGPFKIEIGGAGAFPKRGMPTVLWIGVNDLSDELGHLHKNLELECARVGFPREEKAFHPHLTVARLRKPQGSRTLAATHQEMEVAPTVVEVSDLLVIRSELNSEGSRYSVISRHSLAAKASGGSGGHSCT